jgi:hypothetical protein
MSVHIRVRLRSTPSQTGTLGPQLRIHPTTSLISRRALLRLHRMETRMHTAQVPVVEGIRILVRDWTGRSKGA